MARTTDRSRKTDDFFNISGALDGVKEPIAAERATLDLARSVLLREAEAITAHAERLDGAFCRAVETIFLSDRRLFLSGMGKAGMVGRKIAATFASTGTPAFFLHPAEAVHGDLGAVRAEDAVLILSNSGRTEEILRILPSLERLGVPILSITRAGSPLAEASETVIPLDAPEDADPLGLAPSSSTAVMLALGDALAFAVAARRRFNEHDFARFHPGGSLGLKLAAVEERMRPLSECRVASDSGTVRDVFVASRIPGRRSGAILLLGGDGRLTGLFTDSDLAKLFERRDDAPLDRPVSERMTRSPLFVRAGTRLSDALALMAERKISELPVLDERGVPLGLLDITDQLTLP